MSNYSDSLIALIEKKKRFPGINDPLHMHELVYNQALGEVIGIIRQQTAAPDMVDLTRLITSTRLSNVTDPEITSQVIATIIGDSIISQPAIAETSPVSDLTSEISDDEKQISIEIVRALCGEPFDQKDGWFSTAEAVKNRLRPYLRTTEPVCPYIVTSPKTAEGDGGTSYCRLAEAPKPVSVFIEDIRLHADGREYGIAADNDTPKIREFMDAAHKNTARRIAKEIQRPVSLALCVAAINPEYDTDELVAKAVLDAAGVAYGD